MNPDGSERSLVVPQTHNLFSVTSCGGRYLVFDSYRNGKVELWRTDADGSNGIRKLDVVGYSDCSPDGKWIYYLVKDKLNRVSSEGGAPIELLTVPGAADAWLLRVSPKGDQIAFVFQSGSPILSTQVATVSATGGPLQFTRAVPFGFAGLRWAPSGKALDYLLTRKDATNIWEQPLTGGAPRQISSFPSGRIFDFAWSRDGALLLLTKGSQSSDVILINSFQ
jgi:Tol biopolymer transport system component